MPASNSVATLKPSGVGGPGQLTISVILPNYNHGKWLGRAVEALASQAMSAKEIVLVDDGSTDNSLEIIRDLCQKYDCIRLIRHETNRGAHAAVRTGIAAANGELMLFAAADDFVLPDLLSRGENALRNHPEAAFFCADVAILDRAGHLIDCRPVIPPRFESGYVSPTEMRQKIQHSDNWFIGSSVIYRRSLLREIGYFDERLGTLCDGLATRLLAFRNGFYYEADVLAAWMVDRTTLSSQTALSPSEGRRVLNVGLQWISDRFPRDVRDTYRELFRRRYIFNMARQQLLWLNGEDASAAVCDLLECGRLGSILIHALCRIPRMGRLGALAVVALRMRPVSIIRLAVHRFRFAVLRRAALKRRLERPRSSEHAVLKRLI